MHGYFDESGTHDTSRVTTIAGFVATTDQWRKCLVEWETALSIKHLKQFHASEFDHFVKANKWSDNEYSEFIERLTRILNKNTWFGVSGSVITSAYQNLPDGVRKRIGGRYHFCFHVVMHELAKRLANVVSNQSLTLIFERKDHVIGRTITEFRKNYSDHDYHNQLGDFFFRTKNRSPLLQTADFLVYEMNKWIDEALHSNKPVRQQIELLAKGRKRLNAITYGYHDDETLALLPSLLERERTELEAGRPPWEPWWPASWHR